MSNVEIDEVPDFTKPVYQRFVNDYGLFLNQVKVFAHRPIALRHIMGMLLEMSDNAILDKHYLKIAIVKVPEINKYPYYVAHPGLKLIKYGLTREATDAILEAHCPGLDAVDRLLRDYAARSPVITTGSTTPCSIGCAHISPESRTSN